MSTYVFFSGYGDWGFYTGNYYDSNNKVSISYQKVTGYFLLSNDDERYFNHVGSFPRGVHLLRCDIISNYCGFSQYRKEMNTKKHPVDPCFFAIDDSVDHALKMVNVKEITHKQPIEKNLSESERKTLLKLIIGMAIDAYGYNPESTRNTATGTNSGSIAAKLATHGIAVDDDTIRKYLKKAKELL